MGYNINENKTNIVPFQSGKGIPTHISPLGSVYIDNTTGVQYINKDGLAGWAFFYDSTIPISGGTGGGGAYVPLSGGTMSGTLYAPTFSGGTFYGDGSHLTGVGGTFNGGTVTGSTIFTSGLTANTISATTYQNLPATPYLNLSGGTVTGNTVFTSGLTANTISATTYLNLPATPYLNLSGGTVSGNTVFLSGLTANTISATTYQNLPATPYLNLSGGTVSGNTVFLSGLTANTISATTYQNLPATPYLNLSGGTVSGNTVFLSGLTANTISANTITANALSPVGYIDFNTGTTVTPKGGRLFYNSQFDGPSYYPTNDTNVLINLGQQLYMSVINVSGSLIPKGSAVSVLGNTNGVPNITLAVNVHTGNSYLVGLAADDIPNGNFGFVLNEGILSGLTLNNFKIGDTLYLSPFSAGTYTNSTLSFPYTARTNQIGYVLKTGSTTGEIYVKIYNEDTNSTLTTLERNIVDGNSMATGIYQFTGITQTSSTTFNIAPALGWVVNNTYEKATLPDVTEISYSGGTNLTTPYLTIADNTYVLITTASTITFQPTYPTPQQRRQNLFLGKIIHTNRSSIISINQTVDFDVSPMAALRDLWTPLVLINQGIVPSAYSAGTLSIQTSYGTLWGNGIGWTTNQLNPNSVTLSTTTPTTFQYRTQLGAVTGNTAPYTGNTIYIDPLHYDYNGVVTNIPSSHGNTIYATNQRIYLFPTGLVRIQYGQQYYTTFASAIAGYSNESFQVYSNNATNGILIGILTVVRETTDLTNTSYALFSYVSKFGELLGGTAGISTTTLQQAYNNSSSPEIVINSTLDGLTIQNGTGNPDNTTHLLEGMNASGQVTSFIKADGGFSGSSVSATTYYGLPLDIRTTGATYLNNTFTFTNNTGGTYSVLFNTLTGLTVNGILSATTISGGTFYGNGSGLTLTNSQIISGLTYTPYNGATNPNGYISGITSVITGTGVNNTVAFFNNTNSLSGTTGLTYNGNLGLGTNNPLASTTTRKAFVISDFVNDTTVRLEGSSSIVSEYFTNGTISGIGTRTANQFTLFSNNATRLIVDSTGLISLGSVNPTHTLTFPSTSTGTAYYNTSDQTTNYERTRMYWSGNTFYISAEQAGTGTSRTINFIQNTQTKLSIGSTQVIGALNIGFTSAIAGSILGLTPSLTVSSGIQSSLAIIPTVNQSSTGGSKGIWISPYLQTTGSGGNYLIDAGINSAASGGGTHTAKFTVDTSGNGVFSGSLTATTINATTKLLVGTNVDNGYILQSNGTSWLNGNTVINGTAAISSTITQPVSAGTQMYHTTITPQLNYTSTGQTNTAFRLLPTFSGATGLTPINIIADIGASGVGSQLVITDATTGSTFLVNDISGLPIAEATSTWDFNLYNYPTKVFQKTGTNININGALNTTGSTKTTAGFYSTSAYTSSFTRSIVMDYVTGNGRISVSTGDTITFYNDGVATTSLMTISSGGTVSANAFSATTSFSSVGTYGTATVNAGNTNGMITFAGSGTIGGTGYTDFIKVTNTSAGATTPSKTFRINNNGGFEILNNAYTASTLTLSDNGILYVGGGNTSTSSNTDGTSNYLSFNLNNSQIYDDGNIHIHSRGSGQSMWINTNGGQLMLLNQAPLNNAASGTGVIIGSGTTTLTGFVTINGSKNQTVTNYGYLSQGGAGQIPGGSGSVPYGLSAVGRIQCPEFDATSDERLKDIQGEINIQDAINLVKDIKPIKFTWKDSIDKGLKAGYSAQQVAKVGFGHLISQIPNENLTETIDDDGFMSPDKVQLTMNYDQVTPYHGTVLKYLLEKIELLEKEIQDLKNK